MKNKEVKLSDSEIEALKAFIGNCDGHLTAHILSKTMTEDERKETETTLLFLYNRLMRE